MTRAQGSGIFSLVMLPKAMREGPWVFVHRFLNGWEGGQDWECVVTSAGAGPNVSGSSMAPGHGPIIPS